MRLNYRNNCQRKIIPFLESKSLSSDPDDYQTRFARIGKGGIILEMKKAAEERQHRRQPISKMLCTGPSSLSFHLPHSVLSLRRPVIISRLTGRSLIYDLPKAKLNFPPVIYTFWHFDLPSESEPRFSSDVTSRRLIRRVARDPTPTDAILSTKQAEDRFVK